MKDPMRLIDRFCYRHPNFGIPNLMKYLTIANVVFWILGTANSVLMSYLSFDATWSSIGERRNSTSTS